MRPLICALLVAGFAGAADAPEGDAKKLQGVWLCESATMNGVPLSAEAAKELKITFQDDKAVLVLMPKHPGHKLNFALAADKKPREITLSQDKAELKGIYALDGNELRLCVAQRDDPRPKEFKSEKDSRLTLMILKREKR